MKNIYKILICCLYSTYVSASIGDVNVSALQDALKILAFYGRPSYFLPCISVGSDEVNKKVSAARDHLADMVDLMTNYRVPRDPWLMVEPCLQFNSPDYIPTGESLERALQENQKLLSPPSLAKGVELFSAVSQFKKVCGAIESMQTFSGMCEKNTILKDMLPNLIAESKDHIRKITSIEAVYYLHRYIRMSKPGVLHAKVGAPVIALETKPITIIDMLYDVSRHVDVRDLQNVADHQFWTVIEEVRDAFARGKINQFRAYAQAEKLCPGLVKVWCTKSARKEAKMANAAADTIVRRDYLQKRADEWKGFRFEQNRELQDKGVEWKEALRVMEGLTKFYIQEGDVHQDEVIQFLAEDAAVGLSKIRSDVFVAEQLPQLLRVMEKFEQLDATKRKFNLLLCSAPHLSHRAVLNPKIQELLKETSLNFLAPEFLCGETAQILKELHLLELKGMCSGQVSALSAYITDIDSQACAINWNQVVYDVVLSLQSSSDVRSFLIKMNPIIKNKCSNVGGFWTNALAGDVLKDAQKAALRGQTFLK